MKKALYLFPVLLVLTGWQAEVSGAGEIGTRLKAREPVRVYIGTFADESGTKQFTTGSFRKKLSDALATRRSLKFQVAEQAVGSDIQISGTVLQCQYLERGPLKIIPNAGMMAMDAVKTATMNYVELTVRFIVTDTKTGQVFWNDTNSQYLKELLTKSEAHETINNKVIKSFISNCFGKPK